MLMGEGTCSCEDVQRMIQEELAKLQAGGKLPSARKGGKRKPSQYNVFMGQCVKAGDKSLPITERFRSCAAKYRAQKSGG